MRTDAGAAYPTAWDPGPHPITEDSAGDAHSGADLFLERVIDDVVAGSWLVLEDPQATGTDTRPYRVAGAVERALADFAISGRATGMSVRTASGAAAGDLGDFGMRTTTVH